MITFFLVVVGLIVAIGIPVLIFMKGTTLRRGLISSILPVSLGLLIVWFGLGVREIGPGQIGLITHFGKVERGTHLGSGLTWQPAILSDVAIWDGRVQAYHLH